ncbi:MAG: secretin N-terminal domain-containing protein [Verrucomicrobiales bacterium]
MLALAIGAIAQVVPPPSVQPPQPAAADQGDEAAAADDNAAPAQPADTEADPAAVNPDANPAPTPTPTPTPNPVPPVIPPRVVPPRTTTPQPATPTPRPAIPGINPSGAANGNAGAPASRGGGSFTISGFVAAEADVVLAEYADLTGDKIIFSPTLQGVTITQPAQEFESRDEAILFFKAVLLINGITLVPTEQLGVIKAVGGQSPAGSGEGPPLYKDLSNVPPGEKMIAYIMKVENIGADEAVQTLQTAVQLHPYGRLVAVPSAGAIIIVENVALIRQMELIKEEIDVAGGDVGRVWITLERATADTVKTLIDQILQAQEQARNRAGGRTATPVVRTQQQPQSQNTNIPPIPGLNVDANANNNNAAASSGNATTINPAQLDTSTIQVIADARTNRILVIGGKRDREYIKTLIEDFDAPSEVKRFLKHRLRYQKVYEMLDVVENALQPFVDQGVSGAGGVGGARTTSTSSRSRTSASNTTGGIGGAGGLGGRGGSGLSSADTLGAVDVEPPEARIVGNNTIILGNPADNTLIVSGPPEHLEVVEQLIADLDVRPMHLYLSVTIAAVTLTDDLSYGMDILRTVDTFNVAGETVSAAGIFRNGGGTGILDVGALTDVNAITGAAGTVTGLNTYFKAGEFLNGYLRALESTSKFKVLSRPFVYTANNSRAEISSGRSVPIPRNQQSFIGTGNTQNSLNSTIDYEDVLLKLEVIPLINSLTR